MMKLYEAVDVDAKTGRWSELDTEHVARLMSVTRRRAITGRFRHQVGPPEVRTVLDRLCMRGVRSGCLDPGRFGLWSRKDRAANEPDGTPTT